MDTRVSDNFGTSANPGFVGTAHPVAEPVTAFPIAAFLYALSQVSGENSNRPLGVAQPIL